MPRLVLQIHAGIEPVPASLSYVVTAVKFWGLDMVGMTALEGSGPKPLNGSAGFRPMMLRPFPARQQRAARREDLGQFMRPWAQ